MFCYKNTMGWRSLISHVAFGSADVPAAVAFYREVFGFQECEPLAGDSSRRLGHGIGHHALELRPGSGLQHFGMEIRNAALVDVQAHLTDMGVPATAECDGDGALVALWVTDPDGNAVQLHGAIDRSGERGTDGGPRPQRVDHITFGSPQVETMVAFYTDVLGLRLSDRMEDDFVWMRGDHHHHDVAIVRAPKPALDHFSFEICSWANVRTWCDRFATMGVTVAWGPGRHGPGNNLFVFVDDPDGRHVELSCEMEVFWDDHASYARDARVWSRSGSIGNLWGPLPTWRESVMQTV
jgi:catechol 2,3-dioxygenase